MLIRFRVENFRSFRDAQELSLVASNLSDLQEVVRQPEGISEGLLPVAVIYGANASGKSNVLKALSYMEMAVRNSQKSWAPEKPIRTDPFLLGPEQEMPMTFEVDLLIGGVQFEYGFTLDSECVIREWLNAYPSGGKRQKWFTRDVSQQPVFRFGKQLSGENRAIENLTRKNSLFLSAAAQNNHAQLLPVYEWFADKLFFVTERRTNLLADTAELCRNDSVRRKVGSLMSAADLGILGVEIEDEAPDERLKTVMQAIAKVYERDPTELADVPSLAKVVLRHRAHNNTEVRFTNAKESAGTMAWFSLLGQILTVIDSGDTLCVDELDSSLHPVLAAELVRLFNDPRHNPKGAQLIFNTHDTNLLDAKLFRRDQIWFVEKDREGASHLYALTDYKPRRNENLERGYLQGRYGAIPFVGSLDTAHLEHTVDAASE